MQIGVCVCVCVVSSVCVCGFICVCVCVCVPGLDTLNGERGGVREQERSIIAEDEIISLSIQFHGKSGYEKCWNELNG